MRKRKDEAKYNKEVEAYQAKQFDEYKKKALESIGASMVPGVIKNQAYEPPIRLYEEEKKSEEDKSEEADETLRAPIDLDNYTEEQEREYEEKMSRIRQKKADPKHKWK